MISTRWPLFLAGALLAWLAFPAAKADSLEIVHFSSLDARATPIRGVLYRPEGHGPYPTVVMMHGCSGLFRKNGDIQTNMAAWIKRFVGWGYLVLAVDGFLPRGFRTMCSRKRRPLHALDDRPYDAYGGLAWLKQQSFVRADRIALLGWSNGAMATLSGLRDSHAEKFGRTLRFTAAAAFYPGCMTLAKRTGGSYRPYAPLLVFVGLADNWTFPKPCLKLVGDAAKNGLPVEIAGYEGAYHAFDHPGLKVRTRTARNERWAPKERTVTIGSNPAARDAAITRLRDWLRRHLGDN